MNEETGHKIPATEFTKDMHQQAMAEGWLLSERDDGYLQIQRYDDAPSSVRFNNDVEALSYVARRGREGSYMHQLAMHLDGTRADL